MERIRKAIDHGRDVVVEFAKRLQEPCGGRVNKNPGLMHRLEMEISRLRIEREQELHGIEVELNIAEIDAEETDELVEE